MSETATLLIGALSALGGVLLGGLLERRRWRTDVRRTTYAAFYRAASDMYRAADTHAKVIHGRDPLDFDDSARAVERRAESLHDAFAELQLVASRRIIELAEEFEDAAYELQFAADDAEAFVHGWDHLDALTGEHGGDAFVFEDGLPAFVQAARGDFDPEYLFRLTKPLRAWRRRRRDRRLIAAHRQQRQTQDRSEEPHNG